MTGTAEAAFRTLGITHDEMTALYTLLGSVLVLLCTAIGTVVWTYVKSAQRMRTNHGSKSLGDAVDRMWESLGRIEDRQTSYHEQAMATNDRQDAQIEAMRDDGRRAIAALTSRIDSYHGGAQ